MEPTENILKKRIEKIKRKITQSDQRLNLAKIDINNGNLVNAEIHIKWVLFNLANIRD